MKKIVSFKKELAFKTRVSEITSISLEHSVINKSDDIVSGEFLINGDYKMTEGSINREKYNFVLPFDIALNSVYDISSVKVDIDNFDYEIVDSEFLRVSIDLLIEAKEKEVNMEKEKGLDDERDVITHNDDIVSSDNVILDKSNINIENNDNDKIIENISNDIEINKNNINIGNDMDINKNNINMGNDININNVNNNIDIDNNNINTNLFNDLSLETYKTYYVYIVKEDDTIDKILDKYKITKEDLELYNDIADIKPMDKIIIPQNG